MCMERTHQHVFVYTCTAPFSQQPLWCKTHARCFKFTLPLSTAHLHKNDPIKHRTHAKQNHTEVLHLCKRQKGDKRRSGCQVHTIGDKALRVDQEYGGAYVEREVEGLGAYR